MIKWHEFKRDFDLHDNFYLQWVQPIDSVPEKQKFILKKNNNDENAANLITHDHDQESRIITLDKLTSTIVYSMLILKVQNNLSSNI